MNEIKSMRTELAQRLAEPVAGVSAEASREATSKTGDTGDSAVNRTEFAHLNRGTQRIIRKLLAV
jgi:hypothetical protein